MFGSKSVKISYATHWAVESNHKKSYDYFNQVSAHCSNWPYSKLWIYHKIIWQNQWSAMIFNFFLRSDQLMTPKVISKSSIWTTEEPAHWVIAVTDLNHKPEKNQWSLNFFSDQIKSQLMKPKEITKKLIIHNKSLTKNIHPW